MSNVVGLFELSGKDTIEVCEAIIERVRAGTCTGMVFAIRDSSADFKAGVTGVYKAKPEEVCIVAGSLFTHYSGKSAFTYKIG